MRLDLIRHLWGIDAPWETVFPAIATDGYVGIESPLPSEEKRAHFKTLLAAHEFDLVVQIFTSGSSIDEHLESFERQIEDALNFGPLLINSHSGRDAFTWDETRRFFDKALVIEEKHGVAVAHETHRGRILFHPWITSQVLDEFDDLKLCCDFSHWVCVCERLITDQMPIIEQCADRTIHLHARVGYGEGPQVPDPRAPEFRRELETHERWWETIWNHQKERGMEVSTVTPEFGPPPYLHTLPHTNTPVAHLWDVCNWMAGRLMLRYRTAFG